MAVATPVYERSTVKNDYVESNFGSPMTADELHNANIKENYAKLINPEYKMSDLVSEIERAAAAHPAMQPQSQPVENYARPASAANTGTPVYLVQGARADADLFRADSPINRAYLDQYGTAAAQPAYIENFSAPAQAVVIEEDENEDLRPTPTTTQYRSIDASGARVSDSVLNAYRDGEIPRPEEGTGVHSKISFTKRDKIIMGVVLGLILSVFVLIIVNSAIIAGINTEISTLDEQLVTAQQELDESIEALEDATSYDSVYKFAVENGIVKD